jgi:GT2 family glycosyltransferase
MNKIGVLILNYKNYTDTEECATSVFESDLPKGSKVYVLDNSRTPEKLKKFGKKNPKVVLIDNHGNQGFAGGNNPGVIRATEDGMDMILILNPDVRISKKFFGPMILQLEKDKKLGMIAPALLHKQKDKAVYGLEGHLDWSLMKATHRNMERIDEMDIIDAEFVTFACVLIKKIVFEQVGLLDERFFMYLEDVDFCLRTRDKGFAIGLLPNVVCTHRTSGSFSDPRKKLPISYVSQIKFIDKYLQGLDKLRAFAYYSAFYPYLYLLWTWHRRKSHLGL